MHEGMQKARGRRGRRGLTLIELLVALVIILILWGITLSVYTGVVRWSKHRIDRATTSRDTVHRGLVD